MLHTSDEMNSNHMKKWRSRQGYEKFLQIVQQFTDVNVDYNDELCKQNFIKSLTGGENINETQIITNVKDAAYNTAQILNLQSKKTKLFDDFITNPQPSRQGTMSESNRSHRSELQTTQTLSGSSLFHNQYINQMKKFRKI